MSKRQYGIGFSIDRTRYGVSEIPPQLNQLTGLLEDPGVSAMQLLVGQPVVPHLIFGALPAELQAGSGDITIGTSGAALIGYDFEINLSEFGRRFFQ